MTELRQDIAKSIKAQMKQIAHVRHCSFDDALASMVITFKENAGLSIGTGMESYWLLMVDVAQHEVVPA
jgi:hypothetical protein